MPHLRRRTEWGRLSQRRLRSQVLDERRGSKIYATGFVGANWNALDEQASLLSIPDH
jgi:hypothetical protein